ncbi:bumetanide-sensitive sodium-(potassium)-chloride cotransporter [Eurytemora carolleeae]|uniref:bumetanide-sensitive sodium-(potassium)-chloride cotransporter n=1 Tax=Eurytemora carolleeae TaxID=1294199 RepID=UPI000C763F72|nr:bumetanide-sensitive sodium-(potassium)-chloride cotransporter [Eurytemora carolleeae]|eukprot:XP_023346553.1 bumetanide-sensitive sodium-(potassium)-chloride cotransporter-like [Eurytemora affinis]
MGPADNEGFEDDPKPWNDCESYVYDQEKTLDLLTIDARPSEKSYERLEKHSSDHRPTIEELMTGERIKREEEEVEKTILSGKVVKFGWIEGVFMRCLLNIWGVMLFLRLSWVIGQAGYVQGLIIITLCNAITLITAISMSAVATNGRIASGGVYYMISRALGPEFGGAIGLMFTLANSISVATYTLGFVDNLLDLVYDVTDFQGIVADRYDRLNDLRLIGAPVIVLILLLAIIGMDWVTRVQKLLLLMLIVAQIDMVVGTFLTGGNAYVSEAERAAKGFTSWSLDTMQKNYEAKYYPDEDGKRDSFMSVFGVFFTAVTGIVAGANLSGDLKDPSSAIPKGTLLAIGFTYISYLGFGVLVAFNFLPRTSGNAIEYANNTGIYPEITNCTEEANAVRIEYNLTETSCIFGSAYDQKVMTLMSGTGYLVYLGCYGATLSSAIASLVGAPRVLQAVGRDKIYPKLEFFAVGQGANNDPFRGYILVFLIAFGCLMIGELNTIGSLASNFFLAAYALMNLSVFHSSMTKSPGWRPTFKFYNKWISLIGAAACIVLMFLMDWRLACATIILISILYSLMLYLKPDANWGSSAEALKFSNALNNAIALNDQDDHIKTFRPQILLLCGDPAHRQPLVDFANLVTKKLSVLICAQVIPEDQKGEKDDLKRAAHKWLSTHKIRSFFLAIPNNKFSDAVKYAVMLSGIGRLTPNMVMMGFISSNKDMNKISEYFQSLIASFENNIAVGILRLPNGVDYSSVIADQNTIIEEDHSVPKKNGIFQKKITTHFYGTDGKPLKLQIVNEIEQFRLPGGKGFIDVWWLYDDGGLTLLLPYILQTRKRFKDCKLRVFSLSNGPGNDEEDQQTFENLIKKFRIDVEQVFVIPDITKKAKVDTKGEFDQLISRYPEGSITKADLKANSERTNRCLRKAELLRERSRGAELIVLTLPLPVRGQCSPALYVAWLDIMTKGLPPTLLIRGNQSSVLTFYS